MITNKHLFLLFGLILLALVSFFTSLISGSVDITLTEIFHQLINPEPGLEYQILWELRIPRSFSALVTGSLLALAGVVMQVLLRNPLADPYILGISGGAAVAALGSILLGLSGAWISNSAFVGAFISIFLVFGLAAGKAQWSKTHLLLTGVVISAGWGALINILLTTSSTNTVHSMLFWLMGDLSQSSISAFNVAVLIGGLIATMTLARSLNVLARGDLIAASLGINVKKLRVILYFLASLLTATAVTIAGSVGFVGLIIPHMLRITGIRDHRLLIPCSALLGGSFLLAADTISRIILAPQQLPVGVVTAIIGVPTFLVILRNSSYRS